jgi:putative heme iron utilization protein
MVDIPVKLQNKYFINYATNPQSNEIIEEKYTAVPGLELADIRPSITDKARTITHICTSGTLCTTSVMHDVEGFPFGSYVDYILDEKGWPVLLLSEQSLHTQNIKKNPSVSLFCQLPRSHTSQTTAALSRVTVMGNVEDVPKEELSLLKLAFTLIHPYSEQIVDSPKFIFHKIKPEKIYFSG